MYLFLVNIFKLPIVTYSTNRCIPKMRKYFVLILIFSFFQGNGQKMALFDYPERMDLVERGGYFIYNNEYERADSAIAEVQKILPGHPIVYMMKALNISWREMPIRTTSSVFPQHYEALQQVIESAMKLQEEVEDHEEGVFFEMSARGLLTEYYAREGTYLKALSEARKMYALAKTGFDFVEKNQEYLFSTGLYNYFREMYPIRHPIYKPFMWFFKTGDMELGLAQLDSATRVGKLIKIEATLYLAYIYLRYEHIPEKSLKYLNDLVTEYPNNNYFKSKLIEALVLSSKFEEALPLIKSLSGKADPYYRMCHEVYLGIYYEKKKMENETARHYYTKALQTGQHYENKGLYYRSLCLLGLGRISEASNNIMEAEEYYKQAMAIDDNEAVTIEAKKRLKGL